MIIATNPIIAAYLPAAIESAPNSGPTDLSSSMIRGAGSAPALNNIARSFASSASKPPEICPEPPTIGSLILGALIILLSKIIANL